MPSSVGGDGLVLEVDVVVAAFFLALRALLEARHEPGEREVQVGRFLSLAADDQRRPRFVDEDVVDLVDDREAALALDPLLELDDHVVAQVVEPELVVGAVRDVGGVGLAPGHGAQIQQALVAGREAGLVHERGVVRDHPDAHTEEVEDRSHPLRVAPGQVVVDGDDMDAAAGQRIEDRGQRGDQGLALAGAHLRDLALVEDGATDELDVEVAHPERPLHRLAGHREDFGKDLVESLLEGLVLARPTVLAQFAAALGLGVVQLVVGRLTLRGSGVDLFADLGELGPDGVVGKGLDLGLEAVGLVDPRLDASNLAVIRVDETGKESHGTVKYTVRAVRTPSGERGGAARARASARGYGAPRSPGPVSSATRYLPVSRSERTSADACPNRRILSFREGSTRDLSRSRYWECRGRTERRARSRGPQDGAMKCQNPEP